MCSELKAPTHVLTQGAQEVVLGGAGVPTPADLPVQTALHSKPLLVKPDLSFLLQGEWVTAANYKINSPPSHKGVQAAAALSAIHSSCGSLPGSPAHHTWELGSGILAGLAEQLAWPPARP